MRWGLIAFLVILSAVSPIYGEEKDLSKLAWLAGSWTGKLGRSTVEETWMAPKAGLMLGINRTSTREKASFEFLRIAIKDGKIIYFASPGGRPPTEFALKSIAKSSVVFANPKHDFPSEIRYSRTRDVMNVVISGTVNGRKRSMQWIWRKVGPK